MEKGKKTAVLRKYCCACGRRAVKVQETTFWRGKSSESADWRGKIRRKMLSGKIVRENHKTYSVCQKCQSKGVQELRKCRNKMCDRYSRAITKVWERIIHLQEQRRRLEERLRESI